MRCELRLTKINPNMNAAVIESLYAKAGSEMKAGDKLCDLSVDLSDGFSQYCPPISYYRVVVREKVRLQEFLVGPGDSCDVGQLMAVFATEQADANNAAQPRPLRIATATIAPHPGMWSATDR